MDTEACNWMPKYEQYMSKWSTHWKGEKFESAQKKYVTIIWLSKYQTIQNLDMQGSKTIFFKILLLRAEREFWQR